jgi:hypothetical protein
MKQMNKQFSFLYHSVRDFVAPLEDGLSSMEGMEYLFQKFGWEIELDEEIYGKLKQALAFKEPLEKFIEAVDSVRKQAEGKELDLSNLNVIIKQGKAVIQSISDFEVDNLKEFGEPLNDPDLWEDIANHVLDDLLATYMRRYNPVANALLQYFGIIHYEQTDMRAEFRIPCARPIVKWDQLGRLAANPLEAFNDYYHWNQKGHNFNHRQLLQNMHDALESLKVFSTVLVPPDDFLNNSEFNPSKEYNIKEKVMELYTPFLYGVKRTDGTFVELGLSAIPIPGNGSGPPSGLLIRPVSRGMAGQEVRMSEDFKLDWKIEADASNLRQLKVFPDTIQLDTGEVIAGAAFGFHSTFKKPRYIFGNENTTHLKLQQLSIESRILGSATDPELQFSLRIHGNPGLQAALLLDDSDSFLQETVGKKPLEAGFSPEIVWSSKSGITFNGNKSLETSIALNKEVAGIEFKKLYFSLGKINSSKGSSLQMGLAMAGNFGPVKFSVEKIGCSLDFIPYTREQLKKQEFGEPSVVFGNIGLDLNYLPPKGVGLQLKSGIITGGGFLELDPENDRYAGVMTFKIGLGKRDIGLTAIGLITTRLPNKEQGFSMLVSINTFFTPPIPLAFGFKLNAAGGLIGIHRTMQVDILRERIRKGTAGSIMFPENVTANASKIISDLRNVFPPQKKHYVAAPFFKIGYGKPTILEADIGILIELPFKGRLILMGTLGIYLPNKEAKKRLGEIHVDIFGDVNIAASYILIEGRLRDSNIVKISLTGGFAFMLDWEGNPRFLLSVGGYHPRYKKPSAFPDVPRVTALIKRGDNIRLSCEYYQAITSNSFQIGFSAELVVRKGRARALGFLGFNGLLQFDPLYFETDIRISVEVSYRGRTFFGVGLEFMLSGPEPWRARGYARIKIAFFKLKIKFNISWGDEQKVVPIFINPDALLEKLKIQLQQSSNWSAKLSAGYTGGESLRSIEETELQDLVLLHPSGYLELRQNLIPLNITIEKFGNSKLEAATSYHISEYRFGRGEPVDPRTQKPFLEFFSRGQFEELTDNEKLATPDFDLMTAGIEVTPDKAYDISNDIESTGNDFEDIILGETGTGRQKNSFNWQEETIMYLGGGRKPIAPDRPDAHFGVMEDVPVQREKSYRILSKEALESPGQLKGKYFNSYSGARDFLKTNWPEEQQKAWQVLQTEAEEWEEVVML